MKDMIAQTFRQAREEGRTAFIPFLTAGFPDDATWLDLMVALDRAGADLIEIGLPFSDPLADGPVIQAASHRVLSQGMTTDRVLALVAEAGRQVRAPLLVMTYYQPVLARGLTRFATELAQAGGVGTIIPDLPVEEADPWLAAANEAGLVNIFMAAPTTTPDRLDSILTAARGFLYYVSMTGVTGAALAGMNGLQASLARIKSKTAVPVAVGFGINGPNEARALAGPADGVIVGSALIRAVMAAEGRTAQIEAAARLATEIKNALGPSGPPASERQSIIPFRALEES